MAGPFTHFVICDAAMSKRSNLDSQLWRLLNKYSQFLFVGGASPDLPYLSFKTGNVNWADVMHYEKTNGIVDSGIDELKRVWPSRTIADEVKLVWLLGYVSHLVTDATIHPIVQAIVGPYEQNKEQHRLCEMTEDLMIFSIVKNTDMTYAEFSSILKCCKESVGFDQVIEFWKEQILFNYREKDEEPDPALWFTTYADAVDVAEGGSEIVGLFRHLGIGTSYIYEPKERFSASILNVTKSTFKK